MAIASSMPRALGAEASPPGRVRAPREAPARGRWRPALAALDIRQAASLRSNPKVIAVYSPHCAPRATRNSTKSRFLDFVVSFCRMVPRYTAANHDPASATDGDDPLGVNGSFTLRLFAEGSSAEPRHAPPWLGRGAPVRRAPSRRLCTPRSSALSSEESLRHHSRGTQ